VRATQEGSFVWRTRGSARSLLARLRLRQSLRLRLRLRLRPLVGTLTRLLRARSLWFKLFQMLDPQEAARAAAVAPAPAPVRLGLKCRLRAC
jgi:transposase